MNRLKTFIPYLLAVSGAAALTAGMFALGNHINPITVALVFLLFVLLLATIFGNRPAIFCSLLAMFCLNFFFLPPIGTLTIADPQNWIALLAFLVVAMTAGQLSAQAKRRAEEAEQLYRELQAAFEQSSRAEAFRQSERLKSALLDAVTHDLRTPLTSIKASVTMLIEESQADAIHITLEPRGRVELLEIINEETDRLNSFIESMVELARIEAGELSLQKTRTEVEEIFANALQRAESLTADHRLTVEIEENLPLLSVDPKAIAEVVYNLLNNAAKYSPANSLIKINAKKNGDNIHISVADEGRGIAEADREKVFRKFYRADKTVKGFGMGLAIVRGIVEAHGGKIWIETGATGAQFVFDLPLKKDE
ncbi:MAG: DUF4118 domain-containing protein [Pyrinomonadaceae bacterium]|nr:DUF4118 domain-containing protein [Pyrinomonadaceae bacterium]